MKKEDIEKFKLALENERTTLEKELKSVGRKNPDNILDWEAVPEKMDVLPSDSNEVADSIEAFEENTALVKQLEIRYNEIQDALKKIKNGTYGKCEKGGEDIETDRLEANPAAKTCKAHL